MSIPGVGYDEVGSRTRHAWLRTSLTAMGVTLLAERGLVLAEAPTVLLIAALVPAIMVLAVTIVRVGHLRPHDSEPASPTSIALVVIGAVGLAVFSLLALSRI